MEDCSHAARAARLLDSRRLALFPPCFHSRRIKACGGNFLKIVPPHENTVIISVIASHANYRFFTARASELAREASFAAENHTVLCERWQTDGRVSVCV